MGRSDAKLLGVPGAKSTESQLNAALQELKDDLAYSAAPRADQPKIPESSNAVSATAMDITFPARAKLESCPHCGGKLAALDLKFERCLGCGKQLTAAMDVSARQSQESFTVRL